jgi:hypothetical protein
MARNRGTAECLAMQQDSADTGWKAHEDGLPGREARHVSLRWIGARCSLDRLTIMSVIGTDMVYGLALTINLLSGPSAFCARRPALLTWYGNSVADRDQMMADSRSMASHARQRMSEGLTAPGYVGALTCWVGSWHVSPARAVLPRPVE